MFWKCPDSEKKITHRHGCIIYLSVRSDAISRDWTRSSGTLQNIQFNHSAICINYKILSRVSTHQAKTDESEKQTPAADESVVCTAMKKNILEVRLLSSTVHPYSLPSAHAYVLNSLSNNAFRPLRILYAFPAPVTAKGVRARYTIVIIIINV